MFKKLFLVTLLICFSKLSNAQTCEEYMKLAKSQDYGTTYNSYTSEAISKVTFYEVTIDYDTYYFAIVCFKNKYSFNCSEYIYLVGSQTKLNYSLHYLDSAGKAFWKYIHPYNKNLDCAPRFD